MSNSHPTVRLKANSPQVGQRCPVSGTIFQPGDEVVICEHSDAVFSAKHWDEAIEMWNGNCKYCNTPLIAAKPPISSETTSEKPIRSFTNIYPCNLTR